MNNSWLFFSSLEDRYVDSALKSDADVLVFDLEDGVINSDKKNARKKLIEMHFPNSDKKIALRINKLNTTFAIGDLEVLKNQKFDYLIYPKFETIDEIHYLNKYIYDNNLDVGIVPIIETAKGYLNKELIIKKNHNIEYLIFGSIDFLSDMGVIHLEKDSQAHDLLKSISINLSIFSKIHKIKFIDCPYEYIYDTEAFIKECKNSLGIGAFGKVALHPIQVNIINNIFNFQKQLKQYIFFSNEIISLLQYHNKGIIKYQDRIIGPPMLKNLIEKGYVLIGASKDKRDHITIKKIIDYFTKIINGL